MATQSIKPHLAAPQKGSVLLEALFGILIFSMGILALVGLQASSIKQVSSAKYRSDASLLAEQLVGQMWIGDRSTANLNANFSSPSGPAFIAWSAQVAAVLPGTAANPPTVTIKPFAGGAVMGSIAYVTHSEVTITVLWKLATEAATEPAHRYTLVAQVQ